MNKWLLKFIRNRNIIMLLFFLFLLFPKPIIYANEVIMKVTLEYYTDNGEKKYTVIYQGSIDSELLNFIKKAKPTRIGNLEKTAIVEGCYFIEFFDGKEEKKYFIQNNYWIYDEYKRRYLRCSMLSNLRGYLINYIFQNGYNL